MLRAEVNELGHGLGHAIKTLSGDALFASEEEVRALTKDARRNGAAGVRDRLRALISALSLGDAEGLVRAFSVYLHLANTAEERHRMRVNASRETASLDAPRPQSIPALVASLKQDGWSAEEAIALFGFAAPAPDLHRAPDGDPPPHGPPPPDRGRGRPGSRGGRGRRPCAQPRGRGAARAAGAHRAFVGDVRAAQRAPHGGRRGARRPRVLADRAVVGDPAPGRGDGTRDRGPIRRAPRAAAAGRLPQLDRRRSRRQPERAAGRDRAGRRTSRAARPSRFTAPSWNG